MYRNRTHWRSLDFTCVDSSFGYPVYSIERHHFHHLLYQAADGENTVLLNSAVVDIEDDPSEPHVSVKLADDSKFHAQVVVGADGIRSVTRRILARQAGIDGKNTIRFTGRVHMSGYTAPLDNLGPKDLGVANWVFYDDAILTTWPCIENRQWYIGVKVGSPQARTGSRTLMRGRKPKSMAKKRWIDLFGRTRRLARSMMSMARDSILLQRMASSKIVSL